MKNEKISIEGERGCRSFFHKLIANGYSNAGDGDGSAGKIYAEGCLNTAREQYKLMIKNKWEPADDGHIFHTLNNLEAVLK